MRIDWKSMAGADYADVDDLVLPAIQAKAKKWVMKMGGDGAVFTLDDFIQEGRITASHLWQSYDPARGGFGSYLSMALDNNFKGLLDREFASTRCPRLSDGPNRPSSLDYQTDDGMSLSDLVASLDATPEEFLALKDFVDEVNAVIVQVTARLSPRQRMVYRLSSQDCTKRQIAEQLQLPLPQIESDSAKIRRMFRSYRHEVTSC